MVALLLINLLVDIQGQTRLLHSNSIQTLNQESVPETPWHSIIQLHNITISIGYAQLLRIGTTGSTH